jgi:ribonuclease E
MSKIMLIDAAHAEETRVVVADGNRIEEFDFESSARKQLRGSIYLAKVTRVEPSLQAAFIEYGGNRHGFLAFNEIHPDYYQIPLADREALLRDLADDSDDHHDRPAPRAESDEEGEDGEGRGEEHHDEDDVMEAEVERRRRKLLRKYKIQDVIKRRQIMLVQVVKEERGNKGAALTTYLSLAGRYGVLMPNTARGGGISRKITSATDRKKLKTIVNDLDVPNGMGLIIRTAGAKRTKLEIKRDYEYLMRAWENIREKTMHSIAPALIYGEEDLVKRAIRDMYDKDIEAIVVEGEEGYKEARDFMRMLMPSQAKKISQHRGGAPLFVAKKVEDHLHQIYSPVVPLRSGGYLVINQTEALVAIDVNSGKSTRERNIEATALKTNLEAAEEACRQLRLRDLAGLIVIDFIDMDEGKNNRAVEKKLKDGLAVDRARVQMGKISMFGLMEISRQRRRTGVLEGTTEVCPTCAGIGRVRTTESSALSALRAVELEAVKGGAGSVTLRVTRAAGLYILNEKRGYLQRLNQTHGLFVTVLIDDDLPYGQYAIDRTGHIEGFIPPVEIRAPEPAFEAEDDFEDEEEEDAGDEDADEESEEAEDEENEGGRGREPREGRHGRSRRRRRGGRGRDEDREPSDAADGDEDEDEDGEDRPAFARGDSEGDGSRRRRRRGRRGGRRTREDAAPGDVYSWARMRAPDGDPYVWLDPADVLGAGDAAQPRPAPQGRNEGRNEARNETRSEARDEPLITSAAELTAGKDGGDLDVWVELPARSDDQPSGRSRRGRGRGRGRRSGGDETAAVEARVDSAEPVAEAETPPPAAPVTPEPEPEAAPARKSRSRRKPAAEVAEAAEVAVEDIVAAPAEEPKPAPASRRKAAAKVAAPEPEAEAAPSAPPVPAEPDPAEITAPPAKPKSGWWRR